jgi:hypothetical protein
VAAGAFGFLTLIQVFDDPRLAFPFPTKYGNLKGAWRANHETRCIADGIAIGRV